ncbi:protein-L-isoaspartate(D-aspartate) O-methyltransferase [Actinoplanes octamycinicus]|uniref:Protein-L-isoaspartate O-methyltransferase n=1 Tax=Actinoplanes octamycinicus TaxID=135948 RepID=A0A7W7MCX0_9ACTN|nr:methyltransferase domain-containing protein [Actinoplanes octamycinicus]MBB4745609.1 protein-L-isoaspartate(D-aspartate) O-methyltransferase [Actinoplanes octamycinicus]GIE56452.1 protein-L-isoaspartate O-methyltransferase [Actinoplanes octamycinicus]
MADARRLFLDQIRQDGVPLTTELAAAFATVPRELFVPEGFHRRDGSRVEPDDPEFLAAVYRNDVLVTKLHGEVPVSSSSQPSLMAVMLAALDLRPGLRVLEIGAGTGYNAALMATLGAEVTSVDVQADVAARARSALARAGIAGVRIVAGDGYRGSPDSRYDRVIVTVGVAGLSPHWFEQLTPDGFVLAPVEHAGHHPVLAARPGDPVTAVVVCPSGFMSAAGPLGARHAGSHPPSAGVLPGLTETAPPRWASPLDSGTFRDLWYAAGAWHRRATLAALPGREQGHLALLDESGTGGAVVLPDGSVLAGGAEADRYTAVATALIDRWWRLGRPPMRAWRVALTRDGDPSAPIWAPHVWRLAQARAPR